MEDGLKFNYKLKCKIMEKFGTQNEFAKHIKFPREFVSFVVRGRMNLTNTQKEFWVETLGSTVEELFNE
jgi:plasmid maintenance system antidote protein VapI